MRNGLFAAIAILTIAGSGAAFAGNGDKFGAQQLCVSGFFG